MFCKNCGCEIEDDSNFCPKCGVPIVNGENDIEYEEQEQETKSVVCTPNQNPVKSKTSFGVAMALLLGIIGLIIGLNMYPPNTEERESFLDGWKCAYFIGLVFSIVLAIMVNVVASAYR